MLVYVWVCYSLKVYKLPVMIKLLNSQIELVFSLLSVDAANVTLAFSTEDISVEVKSNATFQLLVR